MKINKKYIKNKEIYRIREECGRSNISRGFSVFNFFYELMSELSPFKSKACILKRRKMRNT